jgi:hypothetical protein
MNGDSSPMAGFVGEDSGLGEAEDDSSSATCPRVVPSRTRVNLLEEFVQQE